MKFVLSVFRKSVEKFQVQLESDKINRCFTWRHMRNYNNALSFFLEWEIFRTNVVEKIETDNMWLKTVFRKSCLMWDNGQNYGTAIQPSEDNVTWHTRFACRLSKATDTHSEYRIFITFLQKKLSHESTVMCKLSVLLGTEELIGLTS
jgi:hypothetical protein